MSRISESLIITNDLGTLPQVRDLIVRSLERSGFPKSYLNRLQIAVEEAVTNIIEHGYAGRPAATATIALAIEAEASRFHIAIEDDGVAFDPQQLPEVDVSTHVATGATGGLGIFLMRRVMDEIRYHYEHGKRNQLVLVKYDRPSP